MNLCPPSIDRYIKNLTSSYTEKSNEASMVSASVIMFVLAGLFFNLNLFSGISDVSATLDPKVRLFLSSALSLLLPVMSYLFSEAKNAAVGASFSSSATSGRAAAELSMGAGLILAWMLLVELLPKKVDEICMRGFSGSIQRAGRVVWLGSLVFFNIRSTGRKALFAILWILCATRVVQRIAYTEIGKNSYAHGKNARLINSYMAKKLKEADDEHQAAAAAQGACNDDDVEQAPGQVKNGRELLKSCTYIVMGEDKLVQQPTADDYELNMAAIDGDSGVVTVGKVWELNENDEIFTSPSEVQRLKRLCLSFALFKLLRRKFERLPAVTDKEAEDCRSLIFRGLLQSHSSNAGGTSTAAAAAEDVFQVMNDEVVFLSEYYHSVVPVVLASPFFLFVNYFLVLRRGGRAIAICLIVKAKNSPEAFFSIVDLSITLLLFVIYFYEEIWEFFVFLLSNWFMVSLVCSYMAKPHWRDSPWIRYAFHRIIWLRSMLNHGSLSFRQFSVLHHRWPLGLPFFSTPSLVLRTELVPKNLKHSIIERLLDLDHGHCTGGSIAYLTPLSNGKAALQSNFLFDKLSCIVKSGQQRGDEAAAQRTAVRLSKYCAYLVAFHPELLPDSPEKTERVVDDMKAELGGIFWCWEYYLFPQSARAKKIMDAATSTGSDQVNGVVRNGGKLGSLLVGFLVADAWKVLADVWTELIVFVAPSSDEERVKGHQDVLVQGGEFITVLWALTTHIGVSHGANKLPVKTLEDLMGESMRNAPHIAPEISIM
ncbi:unnamed protein product [Miscanthus lutarioriparius]|uniref:DUF4220 domain-containing protein n=1 Tax=Miscanthus lutarioriparius TaxID=422564 RepID=A0A811SM55_9POAL|nr:unnamed protein product [Miscanthus lutarioriparius]